MTTTLTPPPSSPNPAPTPPSGAGRVITVILVVVGAIVLAAALGFAIISTIAGASARTSSSSLAVSGVTELDIDVAAGSLTIEYADVDEAELDVRSSWGLAQWTLAREEDELIVGSPQGLFGGGWLFGGTGDAVLRLPQSLQGADADVSLSAGDLRVDGEFGDIDLEVGAGRAIVSGSARELDAQVSAGDAELELEDVSDVSIGVSAGSMDAVFSGAQPRGIVAEVSAGDLDLTVPEGSYQITSDVSAGDFDNRIDSSADARSTIRVQVSAGQATLRAG